MRALERLGDSVLLLLWIFVDYDKYVPNLCVYGSDRYGEHTCDALFLRIEGSCQHIVPGFKSSVETHGSASFSSERGQLIASTSISDANKGPS